MKKHPVAAPDWEDKYHSLGFVAQKDILAAPDWEDKAKTYTTKSFKMRFSCDF